MQAVRQGAWDHPHVQIPFPALRAAGDDTDGGRLRCRPFEDSCRAFERDPPSRVIPGRSREAVEGKGIKP
jgi:hypothetical protein